ncbi:hypothetical protein HOD83_01090 [Candidatus Woesearchaeota archaeon]|jgi:hypothetical protein|nr:hypothetical protein [Candidatus Woesearchaeota archaeon]MBT4114711.1 hypothetical protein [Candidatus Woesearchaeota archaeon]MBT4248167.1 hypothetical protein [Candidatus Woesearchaeota archaeon]
MGDTVKIADIELPRLDLTKHSAVPKEYEIFLQNAKEDPPLHEITDAFGDDFAADSTLYELNLHMYVTGVDANAIRDAECFDTLLDRFKDVQAPSSMVVKDLDELSRHALLSYYVCYEHYKLGKKLFWNDDFPELCCGPATSNVVLTLIEMGYHNALYAGADKDHAYCVLPFVMEDTGEKGIILVDPTAEQMWWSNEKPSNDVRIIFGERWEYKTDLVEIIVNEGPVFAEEEGGGSDLFPNEIVGMVNLRDHVSMFDWLSIPIPLDLKVEQLSVEDYLNQAFANPVPVDILRLL